MKAFSAEDTKFMQQALAFAMGARVLDVSPNPRVGAVLVRSGRVLGVGWHHAFGKPHAEVEAVRDAVGKGHLIKGATLYVTLEPCCHMGSSTRMGKKTPPCVPAVIESGISRVVVGMKDPNPHVSGRGIRALKSAGIRVDMGLLSRETRKINLEFIKWMSTGIPFVAMKVASSLDGKIATRTGMSKWITSRKSRDFVKNLRDGYDAVLVGSQTVMLDNPGLAGRHREPLRVILDSRLRVPLNSHVFRDSNVFVATTNRAPKAIQKQLEKRGISFHVFGKKIQIDPLLRHLGKMGVSSVFVEGGAKVFGSFVDAKEIDRVYWFVAPKIIGGEKSRTAVAGFGAASLDKALSISGVVAKPMGPDFYIEGAVTDWAKRQ